MTSGDRSTSRRELLWAGAAVFLAGAGATRAKAAGNACVDLSAASANAGLRTALNFTEVSKDPAKTCGACAFFTAEGACGSCKIFSGPTNPQGFCESWSPRT